jgi:hypothetical protein
MGNVLPKYIFMDIVEKHLYEHPEWMADVIKAASDSVLQKVKDSRKTSVDVQFAFSMVYDGMYGKLSKENKIQVNKAMLECDALEGTPFAKMVKERLDKLEK